MSYLFELTKTLYIFFDYKSISRCYYPINREGPANILKSLRNLPICL